MCHFHYKKFDSCGDYGIKIGQVCDEALWVAGLRGVLRVCVPGILERSLEWSGQDDQEPPKPAFFMGYDGFCEVCVTRFMLPRSIPRRSYSDHELDYTLPWNSFDPHDLAPYVSFDGLASQIPQLLGVSDQFNAANLKQGPLMIFHKSLQQGSWSEIRKSLPFTYHGEFQAGFSLDLDETMKRLNIIKGITRYDRDQVVHAIQYGGLHPRVVYNHLFKHRGMPLGHFNLSIVQSCQQAVSQLRAENAAAANRSLEQCRENSEDSTLTELTDTPVLSDMEIPASTSPAHGSDQSESAKYDGAISTPRRNRKLQALQKTLTNEQGTTIRLGSLTGPSPQYAKAFPIILPRPSAGGSHCDVKQDEMDAALTPCYLAQNGRRDPKAPSDVPEDENQGIATKVDRPRRMAITEQDFDGTRLRPLAQGSGSTDTLKSARDSLHQRHESGLKFQEVQHLKDPALDDGSEPPASANTCASRKTSSAPYYGAARELKWKVLERPGYEQAPATGGSQGRKSRGRRGCQQLIETADQETQAAQHYPVQQHPIRIQEQHTQTRNVVVITDDADQNVSIEQEVVQNRAQPKTHLDPSTVRRLGLSSRCRRR